MAVRQISMTFLKSFSEIHALLFIELVFKEQLSMQIYEIQNVDVIQNANSVSLIHVHVSFTYVGIKDVLVKPYDCN